MWVFLKTDVLKDAHFFEITFVEVRGENRRDKRRLRSFQFDSLLKSRI